MSATTATTRRFGSEGRTRATAPAPRCGEPPERVGTSRRARRTEVPYLVVRSLDLTGRGRKRWMNRWKAALDAFAITFQSRILPTDR